MKFREIIEVKIFISTGKISTSLIFGTEYKIQHNYAFNCCGGKQLLSKILINKTDK